MKDLEKLTEAYGDVQTLTTPSGHMVTIREQTGEDDDILSNAKGVIDGTSTNKFIAGIVVQTDLTENGKMNLDTARNLKLCDKYFIMIASRIFSIGQTLKFTYEWPEPKGLEVDYEEDLGLYIWEYHNEAMPFPGPEDEEYYKYRIKQHPHGKDESRKITLASGKKVRYNFMNGVAEKYLMELPQDRQSVNAELFSRGVAQEINKAWVPVQNFKGFTPNDMRELRNDIKANDPDLALITELYHPVDGSRVDYLIVGTNDFFYPREI